MEQLFSWACCCLLYQLSILYHTGSHPQSHREALLSKSKVYMQYKQHLPFSQKVIVIKLSADLIKGVFGHSSTFHAIKIEKP